MKSIYEQYAVINSKMEDLKNQKESLRTEILENMIEKGEDKAETAVGKFTISQLKKWVYSENVAELSEEFKALKAEEESRGIATYTEEPSLRYTPIKL